LEHSRDTTREIVFVGPIPYVFWRACPPHQGGANPPRETKKPPANLKMEKLDSGWAITAIHLDVSARVPNSDDAAFQKAAEDAKEGCPVSKVLNAKITMSAKLER